MTNGTLHSANGHAPLFLIAGGEMFVKYNPNPDWATVGDCTVRAITKALGTDWESAYWGIAIEGSLIHDMPSSNHVWGSYLRKKGFKRYLIPNTCPDCYTVSDFAEDYPNGTYLLATGTHVVTVVDGDYYDTWDSGDEVPIYFWTKEESDGV